jgi:lipopolysaccharide export system protein LptA
LKLSLLFRCLWVSSLLLSQSTVLAEKADKDKPLNIEADKLDYDDLKQLSIFVGRVSLIKGSIDMRAERLEVRQDADGFQFAVLSPKPGDRVSYRQKRDIKGESVEGLAQKIEYDGREDKVILLGNAELRRYRGGVLSDEMSGQRIVYENLTDRFSVDGRLSGANAASSGLNTGARVKVIINPAKNPEAKP